LGYFVLGLKRQIELEKQSVTNLIQDSENLVKSFRIRSLIEAVIAEHKNGNPVYIEPEKLEKWIKWAGDQADRIDPLKANPYSVIDEECEISQSR
jgi:hypothetical protein